MNRYVQTARPLEDLPSFALSQLELMLDGAEWRDGGRLPPEAELAEQIGVSRPVLRKALASLRDLGRIVSRRGSGNFVQPAAVAKRALPSETPNVRSLSDMRCCVRFRLLIECGAAEDAAHRRDPNGIQELVEAYRQMQDPAPGACRFEADFAFHMAIALATQNPYYAFALSTIKEQMRVTAEFIGRLDGSGANGMAVRANADHGRLLEAIQAGTPGIARELMNAHITQIAKSLPGEESDDGFSS